MPIAAGTQRRAIAQNVDCQPRAVPSTAPAGTPATVATVVPASRIDTARPLALGATSFVAAPSATAKKLGVISLVLVAVLIVLYVVFIFSMVAVAASAGY